MELFEALLNRRSIRRYESGFIVPEEEVREILKAGMYSPSAMGRAPWEFLIVTDQVLLQEMEKIHSHAAFLSDAGIGIVVCIDTTKEYNSMGMIDVSMASQNIMLAAYGKGYGTCYCGLYPSYSESFSSVLQIPPHIQPIGLIALGKPTVQPAFPDRFKEEKLHFNRW